MRVNSAPRNLGPLLIAVAATSLLAACSSGPKIFVNQAPDADLSAYKTYNYAEVLGTDNRGENRSILTNYLINAVDRELQGRGYSKSNSPELLVNFYVNTKEKIRSTTSPSMGMTGGYYGYRGGYYGAYGGYETTVSQYTEGTLNIDLVDNASKTLIWEGIAEGRIDDEVRENVQGAVNIAVRDIFAKYPYTAQGFVPATPAAAD